MTSGETTEYWQNFWINMLPSSKPFDQPVEALKGFIAHINRFKPDNEVNQKEKDLINTIIHRGFDGFDPKRIWVSQNLERKIAEFLAEDSLRERLIATCHKIGLGQADQFYCVGTHTGCIWLSVRGGYMYYIMFNSNEQLYCISQAKFRAEEYEKYPFEIEPVFFDLEPIEKVLSEKVTEQEAMKRVNTGMTLVFMFLHFVDINEVTVAPGAKYKPAKYAPVKNNTKRPFIVADVNWSQPLEVKGHAVRGHYRMQPYGEKRTKVKLIYIEPFVKGTHIRRAGKDRLNDTNTENQP